MYTELEVNACELINISARLRDYISSMDRTDPLQFSNLCISLARCIDYALAIRDVPKFDWEFPRLLKQVCEQKDWLLQAAIMVLMISVKTACKNGWFMHNDSEELQTLAQEIGSAYCCTKDIDTEMSNLESTITTILSRFYPQMKIDEILTSLAVKPGYEAYVVDFQIPKNLNSFPPDVWLFVAEIENLETSACIISPQQVNFLMNGKGVESRSNVFMDDGPQLPTNVTKLLKYGTNLLQAVGQFNGNYVIIVACMSLGTPPLRPSLQDYVQPTVALLDSDLELIEGPSRVSLSCPISMKRIKIPVKGHSCKHHQCFDLDNYVEMNLRRPSWRCPHCNQSVCFNDIRIDQKMVKILEEVGVNVAGVMISADGSWKAATESNDQSDKQHDKSSNCIQDVLVLPQKEPKCAAAYDHPDIMDLTEEDNEINILSAGENECVNPLLVHNQDQLSNPCSCTSTDAINQNTSLQIEDRYRSGVYLPMHGSETSGGRIDAQVNGVSVSAPTSYTSPVLTDVISPALNREPEGFDAPSLTASVAPSQIAVPVNTPLKQFSNFDMVNEYGRFPTTSTNTNTVPVTVQGLPVQGSTYNLQQRPTYTSQMSSNPLMVNGSYPYFSNVERHQRPGSHLSSHQGSYMSLSSLQQHIGSWGPQGQFGPSRPSQPNTIPPASGQHPGGYGVPTVPVTHGQNLHQQQSIGQRMSNIQSQFPSLARSSTHLPPNQNHQGGPVNRFASPPPVGQQQGQFLSAAERASYVARIQSQLHSTQVQAPPIIRNVSAHNRPFMGNTGGTVQTVTRPEDLVESSAAAQEWRPTGRMRGSLSGEAYSAALNHFINQPTQTVQPTRPLTNVATSRSNIPYQLRVLRTMQMNATNEAINMSTRPASTAG